MVKENGLVMMTEEEFKSVCKCYEKNLSDQQNEHEYETDLICKDYERTIDTLKKEHEYDTKHLTRRIELLQKAVADLIHTNRPNRCKDVRVSKKDFLEMYQKALDEMFAIMDGEKETDKTPDDVSNDIYGHDITVHWNGIYCNCGDGATPSNILIPAIEEVLDEDDSEYEESPF